jgi:hypothetical protein
MSVSLQLCRKSSLDFFLLDNPSELDITDIGIEIDLKSETCQKIKNKK